MVRAPYFDENGIKKGAWSEEEDHKLIAYIERHGHPNWRQLPKYAGLSRCGKSCRLRWMNYLRPNLKRGKYTPMEEQMIMELHKKHGNKWSMIAENLVGRTDNEIKNYWHSHLKRFSKHNETNFGEETEKTKKICDGVSGDSHHILESSLSMSSEISYTTTKGNSPSISSEFNHVVESNVNLYRKEDSVASWETLDGFSNNFWTEPFVLESALSQDCFPISFYCGVEAEDPFFYETLKLKFD